MLATQFSIGLEYWSCCHSDEDFFYTTLSCLSDNPDDFGEVLYYFVFPKWGVAVPLRSGETLAFNPLEEHCCTNFRQQPYLQRLCVCKDSVFAHAHAVDVS